MLKRRSRAELPERIEALHSALQLAGDRLDAETTVPAAALVDKARERLRHGTTHTVAALLGATGSGKSSLTNALAGTNAATTGVRRPTTSSTLACFWGHEEPHELLDWLEVVNRYHVGQHHTDHESDTDPLDGLVLLDVPDHDSVQVSHRLEMERIARHVDLLVWVTDAEKYGDNAMHTYLREMSGHGAVTVMVLNKIDMLTDDERKQCIADISRLLAADGLPNAPVVELSANSGEGVTDLRAVLTEAVERKAAMTDRLGADCSAVSTELLSEVGAEQRNVAISPKVGQDLASALVDASGLSFVTDAVEAGHRRDAAARVGWPFTRWARKLRPHPLGRLHLGPGSGGRSSLPEISGVQLARAENAVRQTVGTVTDQLPEQWVDVVRGAGTPNQAALNNQIDNAVSGSVRRIHDSGNPKWWTAVNLIQLLLAGAAVAGAIWLALLAFGAYLRLPDIPTPEFDDVFGPVGFLSQVPIPTGLLIGGIVLGLLLAAVSMRLVTIGSRRRASAVRSSASAAVQDITDDLVIDPMQAELDTRTELQKLLTLAAGSS